MRCVIDLGEGRYEERTTLWQSSAFDEAIALAENEATSYADGLGRYIGLAQAYKMDDEPGAGAEVFSLIRHSALDAGAYLSRFFDTGSEHQRGT